MRRTALLAATIYVIALTVRLLPLLYSPLPYNIDGFSLVNIAERTQASGHLLPAVADPNLPNYKVPVFAALLTELSDLTGVPALTLVQPVIPILTATSILAIFVLVRRLTKSDAAAGAAGLWLALEGTYVFSTATAIKASLAFALVPLILLLYWGRADPRKRGLAAFLLVVLPWVHHGSSLLAFSIVTLLLAADAAAWWRDGTLTVRALAIELGLGPALLIPGLLWYHFVDLMYLRQVADPRQILLFLSVLFLAALVVLRLSRPTRAPVRFRGGRTSRGWRRILDAKLLVPIGALAVLAANAQGSVFAGTIRTKPGVFLAAAPLVALVLVAVVGFNLLRHARAPYRPLAAALLLGPLAVMAFAFLRGLDPLSYVLMYRSAPYLAVGFGLCAGVGLAVALARIRSPARKAVLVVGFATLLALTLPLGYASEALYDVENGTAPYEFRAMTFAHGLRPAYLGADQRVMSTMSWYFFESGDGEAPSALARGDLAKYDLVLVQTLWTTQGAQRHPLPNVVVGGPAFASALERNDVIYTIVSPIGDASIVRVR